MKRVVQNGRHRSSYEINTENSIIYLKKVTEISQIKQNKTVTTKTVNKRINKQERTEMSSLRK